MIQEQLSRKLVSAFFDVHHQHGHGFLESVYANALAVELEFLGLTVRREVPVVVHHRGREFGKYRIDLLLEDAILVEVKASLKLGEADQRQLINYLKATPYELGFLFNFGSRPTFLRRVLSREHRHSGLATC